MSNESALAAFVGTHLPPRPARVLEVGCGGGDLTREMSGLGYDALGIDPEAPAGDLFRAVSLEQLDDTGPFDAVVASRALHHIPDLSAALDKIERLLRPGGRLLVYEHAWDRMDQRTARWYLARRAATDPHTPSLDRCLAHWEQDHADLHGYAAIRAELDRRFTERFFSWSPYLYRELRATVSEREEQELIDTGAIRAIGFLYVGERG
jgi:SAM-dependent methyltransferase